GPPIPGSGPARRRRRAPGHGFGGHRPRGPVPRRPRSRPDRGRRRRLGPARPTALRCRPAPARHRLGRGPLMRRRSGGRALGVGAARRVRRRRVAVTGLVTACCFLTLLTRLVHLQVAARPAYAARAAANRWRGVPLEAPRGRILDRAGYVLADSGSAWRIRLDRRVPAARRPALLLRLAPVL